MVVSDYTAHIKNICDSLSSININIEEDEMVQVCLGGLAQRLDPIRTEILARENPPSFFDLQSMLLVEENFFWTKSKTSEGQLFFSNSDAGRRRGHSGRRGRFGPCHEGNSNLWQEDGSHQGTFGRRRIFHTKQGQQTMSLTCNYCGKIGHREDKCQKKRSESAFTSQQLTNYAIKSEYDDYGGLFVMRHRANSMITSDSTSTSNSEDMWFVDSGASHHMMSHQQWFSDLWMTDRPGYIERETTPHIPFGTSTMSHLGKKVNKLAE